MQLQNLTPTTDYEVRVTAQSQFGESKPGTTYFRTAKDVQGSPEDHEDFVDDDQRQNDDDDKTMLPSATGALWSGTNNNRDLKALRDSRKYWVNRASKAKGKLGNWEKLRSRMGVRHTEERIEVAVGIHEQQRIIEQAVFQTGRLNAQIEALGEEPEDPEDPDEPQETKPKKLKTEKDDEDDQSPPGPSSVQ